MSLRLTDWLWYFLAIYAGSLWAPARGVTVRGPPAGPATVEAQAKFFQDFFSVQLSPYKIEFGHVCEDPNTWEQRYEKKDFKNHRDMGKVRWGDKKGGYGEHYWDLNHAGHGNDHGEDRYDHGSDDGSYHDDNNDNDPYDEPSDNSPTYGNEEYNPEKSSYEENDRTKRAHPKIRVEQKNVESEEEPQPRYKRKHHTDSGDERGHHHQHRRHHRPEPQPKPEEHKAEEKKKEEEKEKDKKQVVLVVAHKEEEELDEKPHAAEEPKVKLFVPYESGAGVRQHQRAEVTAAASVPRLFLESSTGHVVDRATGQAYVLQPIARYY